MAAAARKVQSCFWARPACRSSRRVVQYLRMLNLRLATTGDAQQIADLSRDLIERGLGWTWHRGRVLRSLRARETNVLVATEGSQVIGFAIMEYGDTRAHLLLLGVRTDYQRRGIGKRLLAWLEETALVAGISTIALELRQSNYGARHFYHQLGFVEVEYVPGYYRGVETAIRMSRRIGRHAQSNEEREKGRGSH